MKNIGNGISLFNKPVPFSFHTTPPSFEDEHWFPSADENSFGHLVSCVKNEGL